MTNLVKKNASEQDLPVGAITEQNKEYSSEKEQIT